MSRYIDAKTPNCAAHKTHTMENAGQNGQTGCYFGVDPFGLSGLPVIAGSLEIGSIDPCDGNGEDELKNSQARSSDDASEASFVPVVVDG
ncbi:hypothetical protein KC350_g52 [Hortaea werneckii]|nr:hypothetical protein KC350_g52 [Hortaea werneckii]